MAKPNPQLEAALSQFSVQPGATPIQEAQLRAAVLVAPSLGREEARVVRMQRIPIALAR